MPAPWKTAFSYLALRATGGIPCQTLRRLILRVFGAAGAVVARDVKPYQVVGGVPAVKIAERPKGLNYNPATESVPMI